jgi:hypothetical protein
LDFPVLEVVAKAQNSRIHAAARWVQRPATGAPAGLNPTPPLDSGLHSYLACAAADPQVASCQHTQRGQQEATTGALSCLLLTCSHGRIAAGRHPLT